MKIASAHVLECLGIGSVVIVERGDGERVPYSHVAGDVWLSKSGILTAAELAEHRPESTYPPRVGEGYRQRWQQRQERKAARGGRA